MPKKRSVHPRYSKALQRLYRRVGHGPVPEEPETPDAPPGDATAVLATPKTPVDVARLQAAHDKRLRRAARRLQSC